jgi:hypothetical protein
MGRTYFKTQLDALAAEQRLREAAARSSLEVWGDMPDEVKVRVASAGKWREMRAFMRISFRPDGAGAALEIRSDIPRLLRFAFWWWVVIVGGITVKEVLFACLGLTHGRTRRAPLSAIVSPVVFALWTGVMLLARYSEDRALRRSMVSVLRRELGAQEVAD